MIYIFLGAPGTGKGTISFELSKNHNFKQISTGEIFRAMVKTNSPLGNKLQEILNAGSLVDDKLTIEILKETLENYDLEKDNIILDGVPRTINQAELIEQFLEKINIKIKKVVNFELSQEKIIKRLSGRLMCPVCGKTYHKEYLRPIKLWVCDIDQAELITRKDDEKESIIKRLENYNANTKPLIDFYKKKNLLIGINADQDIPEITKELISKINEK